MITPDQIQELGTAECVRMLGKTVPEIHRAFQVQRASMMSYKQCLEMMVIALANNSEHYQSECVRLIMNQPVSITLPKDAQL